MLFLLTSQHNKYFLSRISSSVLLCGHVSLVRRRSCVTPALPTPQRWSDESRAEIKRRERNSTIKLKRNQILFLDLFQIFLFDKFQKSVAQHLYFTTSVIDSYWLVRNLQPLIELKKNFLSNFKRENNEKNYNYTVIGYWIRLNPAPYLEFLSLWWIKDRTVAKVVSI